MNLSSFLSQSLSHQCKPLVQFKFYLPAQNPSTMVVYYHQVNAAINYGLCHARYRETFFCQISLKLDLDFLSSGRINFEEGRLSKKIVACLACNGNFYSFASGSLL